MTNIILLICCILGGFLLGRFLQKRVLARNDMFTNLVKYVAELKLNVNGKQVELDKFNTQFGESCSDVFRCYLTDKKSSTLSERQKKMVDDFFANLNCTSGNQLLQHLEFYEKQFNTELETTSSEAKKSSVYVKIGLLLGAMVGILFL